MSKTRKPATPATRRRIEPLRETAVYNLTFPNVLKLVRDAAEAILAIILEASRDAPPLAEAPIRAKARAMAADLDHEQRFLHRALDEPEEADLGEGEEFLAWLRAQARDVARIARRVERRLGPAPGSTS